MTSSFKNLSDLIRNHELAAEPSQSQQYLHEKLLDYCAFRAT